MPCAGYVAPLGLGFVGHRAMPCVGYVAPLGLGFVGDLNLDGFTLTWGVEVVL